MKITEIRINKFENKNTKAFATVTFDSELVISGFIILQGKNGLFVSMPQSKGKDGKYYDSVFPLSKEGRKTLNEKIIEKYNEVAKIQFS